MDAEQELINNLKDKYWRLNHLYHITNKENEDIIFKFNDEQQLIWDNCFVNGVLSVNPNILKARQLGITTFFVINYFDDCIWNENLNVYIQSHDQQSIEKVFRIVKYAYRMLLPELKPVIDRGGGSKFEYYFPDINSRIYVGLENRSSAVHRLHLSEVAFQDTVRIAATLGALPPGICYSNETTPNGMNWYYDDWISSQPRRKNFFFPWFKHAAYTIDYINSGEYTLEEQAYIHLIKKHYDVELTRGQIEFRRQKVSDLKSQDNFDQEYPSDEVSCFLSSGSPFFDLHKVRKRMLSLEKPIEIIEGCINIFQSLDQRKLESYILAADPAEGNPTSDNSVAIMICKQTKEIAASISGKWKPSEFAHKLNRLALMYKREHDTPPLLVVERNNHGHAVLLELDEHIHYANLFYDDDNQRGWKNSNVSRPMMLSCLKDYVDDMPEKLNDKELLQELLTFVYLNGKPQAAIGKHDDYVLACGMAIYNLQYADDPKTTYDMALDLIDDDLEESDNVTGY